MLILDKLRHRESKDEPLSLRGDGVDGEHIDSRKIIDFESARLDFERDHSTRRNAGETRGALLSNLRIDRSSGVAESLVTIILVLVIGLSLLLGMIWGF
jgi:hypothetical protein